MGCFQSKTDDPKHIKGRPSATKAKSGVHELKMNYKISNETKVLGAGAFGKVFLSESLADPNFKVAIKVLNKEKLADHIDAIKEEVRILTNLDHANIVKYYETYDDNKYMYLVMEYCPGGELFDKIASQQNQMFNESDACQIMDKLFRAVNHCHANGVVHRDIKPENIMIGSDGELKLIDFGLSKQSKNKAQALNTIAGTPYYMAPEVLDGRYDYKCDIWSLGVLLYILVSGYLPFQGETRNEVFRKICNADYHFNHKEFKKVSDECKDLISHLLLVDPKARYDGTQSLHHKWFKKFLQDVRFGSEEDKLDGSIIKSLKSYKGGSKLKKAAMNLLVKMLNTKEIESLRQQFRQLDKDGTGMISAAELKQALHDSEQVNIPETEINAIINELDYQGNQKINYSEFIAATIKTKEILTHEKLQAIFWQFDTDRTGFITKENIVTGFKKLGRKISAQELDEIMKVHDTTKDDKLSFDEFKSIFMEIS